MLGEFLARVLSWQSLVLRFTAAVIASEEVVELFLCSFGRRGLWFVLVRLRSFGLPVVILLYCLVFSVFRTSLIPVVLVVALLVATSAAVTVSPAFVVAAPASQDGSASVSGFLTPASVALRVSFIVI